MPLSENLPSKIQKTKKIPNPVSSGLTKATIKWYNVPYVLKKGGAAVTKFKGFTKEKLKEKLKTLLLLLFNPRLLLCFLLAWMITNGWSYVFIAVGGILDIKWMFWLGTAYSGFLWFPLTPEKIVTIPIAIFLLRLFFPNDKQTLGVLRDMLRVIKEKRIEAKEKRNARRATRRERRLKEKRSDTDNETEQK